jgi:hypothetical protein
MSLVSCASSVSRPLQKSRSVKRPRASLWAYLSGTFLCFDWSATDREDLDVDGPFFNGGHFDVNLAGCLTLASPGRAGRAAAGRHSGCGFGEFWAFGGVPLVTGLDQSHDGHPQPQGRPDRPERNLWPGRARLPLRSCAGRVGDSMKGIVENLVGWVKAASSAVVASMTAPISKPSSGSGLTSVNSRGPVGRRA